TWRTPRSSTPMTPRCSRPPRRRPSSTSNARPPGAAIEADAVTKRYGAVTAVDALTLRIASGEVFCLLGPNGSGKTTFLRMLTGYLSPSAGRIVVAGHDTVREPMPARRRIGYLPEAVPLYREMRVRECLAFMARLRHVPAADVAAAVDRVTAQL